MTHPSPLRIEPVSGYSSAIGRLVGMLTYARSTTLAAVAGLSTDQLDHLHDPASNSIGALLAHIGAVERSYGWMTLFTLRPESTRTGHGFTSQKMKSIIAARSAGSAHDCPNTFFRSRPLLPVLPRQVVRPPD
jgi:hypothetical protein